MRFTLVALLCALPTVAAEPAKPTDFSHDVLPILKARCAECHTNGKYKGSLSFDTREDLLKSKTVVVGKSAESNLLKRVQHADKEKRMPPKGEALTAKEIAALAAWIDGGLTWEPGFSFKTSVYVAPLKPRRVTLPVGTEHPIDRLLQVYFASQKVTPPAQLADAAFLRRVSLDLIGLLPTPTELDEFVADKAPEKRALVVRRLLDDKRCYTEHWLAFWNDLLRNEYAGTGFIDGGRKQISAWLYASLYQNKPYDRFVRELITPTPESEGFIKGIQWRGTVNASQVTELQFAQNVGQVFFGVNLKCASCHDSFIDTWKLDDAYSFAAIIANKPLAIHRCDKATGQTATPRFLFPELGTIDKTQTPAQRLQRTAELVTHADNGRFTRTIANRLWQRLFGRGLVQPVDVMSNKPWSADLLDYLAVYLSDHNYDLKKLLEHITTSQAYQAKSVANPQENPGDEFVYRGPELKRLSAEQFFDALWMLTNTAPPKPVAPVTYTPHPMTTPKERQLVRASLMNSNPLMRSLGRPNREQVVTSRPEQLSTLQALDLTNGAMLNDLLARGAANLLKEMPKATAAELSEKIFRQALCRLPTAAEKETAQKFLGDTPNAERVADLLWVVVMLPEFQLVR